MRFENLLALLFFATALLESGGCKKTTNERPKVSVSIFPVYDLVRRVAGPDADVALLLPPGTSEHHFEPTPKDLEKVAASRLGVMVGLELDPWMETLMKDAAPTARVLKIGDRVPTLTSETKHDQAAIDPHVWLDPTRARLIVKAISEELARADSAHATAYRQRALDVDTALETLDKEVETKTAAWSRKNFVSANDSFGYFADRYHLTIDAPAAAVAGEVTVSLGVLDPLGGTAQTDTYEKLIRFDVAALDQVLR